MLAPSVHEVRASQDQAPRPSPLRHVDHVAKLAPSLSKHQKNIYIWRGSTNPARFSPERGVTMSEIDIRDLLILAVCDV